MLYFAFFTGTTGNLIVSEDYVAETEKGSLYRLDIDGSLSKWADKINISNGLAWSSDHRTMFYVDSTPRKVYGFDYDIGTGVISKWSSLLFYNIHS